MAIAPSKVVTSATTKIFASVSAPATYDAAGFAALTWTELAEVSSIGEFGGTNAIVNFTPLASSYVVKRVGSTDFGELQLEIGYHQGGDSQLLRGIFNSRLPAAFKIVLPSAVGQTVYFTAVVSSNPINISNADSILMSNVSLAVDNEIIFV